MNKIFALFVATLLVANSLQAITDCLIESTESPAAKCYLCKNGKQPAADWLTCVANPTSGCLIPSFKAFAGLMICELCEKDKFPIAAGGCEIKTGTVTTPIDATCGLYTIVTGGAAWSCAGCTGAGLQKIDASSAATSGKCLAGSAVTGSPITVTGLTAKTCEIGFGFAADQNTCATAATSGAPVNAQYYYTAANTANLYWGSAKSIKTTDYSAVNEIAGCWLTVDGTKCAKCRQAANLKITVKKNDAAAPYYEVGCATYTKPTAVDVKACVIEYSTDGTNMLCQTCIDSTGAYSGPETDNKCKGAAAAANNTTNTTTTNSSILSVTFAALLMLIINRLF